MKRSQLLSLFTAAVFILALEVPDASTIAAAQQRFRIKEYELFHDILEPLQHEALPQRDYRRIRSMANELVSRGKGIVKLGVPQAPKTSRREFAKALGKFDKALARFKTRARKSSNTKLEKSFSGIQDSFEKLVDLVPTVYPLGMPPTISLDCPSIKPEAGGKITLNARSPDAEELSFLWTVGGAKILSGQGTPTITIDTTGLAGQTISVTVEVDGGFGLIAAANCEVQIAASQ